MEHGKKRVLVIDDEEDFSFFVKKNLEENGSYEVSVANDGEAGLKLAQRIKPDVILLDIIMPKMSGPDVAEALLDDPLTKKIPLVFLTAVVTNQEIGGQSIKKIGKRNFIAKPVSIDRLRACIDEVLVEREGELS